MTLLLGLLVILFILPFLCYFAGHPLHWFLYLLLLILLLPSILVYGEIAIQGIGFVTYKQNEYRGLKTYTTDFLSRRFGLKIQGQQVYDHPVIFIVNHHEPGAILDNLIMMTLKTRAKAVTYRNTGLYKKLFQNIEHLEIARNSNNRLEDFLHQCTATLAEGTSLIIFPEGKYTKQKKSWRNLYRFQTGAFILACQTSTPIVPLLISGDFHHSGIYSKVPIRISYGPEILPGDHSPESLRDFVFDYVNSNLKTL